MNQSWEMQVFTYYQNGILRFIQLGNYLKEKGFRPIEAIRMVFRFINKYAENHTASRKNDMPFEPLPQRAMQAFTIKNKMRKGSRSLQIFQSYIHTG
ncbi:hypothetical protein PP175_24515 [Aneurinibacillus sp. Ricciae_BoGa-3]|uniref:hypothetical protein n=1 Tax=Aneurinibacillus sp. Ricciae_BoGa-3 TaxID=3022697 RepID=UPI0023418004|nr:hypothetical protein [Aneurinibacillus sp. Ricciae_BoGa-3]WCK54408.1 hypothetical protein PP175_24515 [Aneurinibacillus sp. Ricciae_BoGa-3]